MFSMPSWQDYAAILAGSPFAMDKLAGRIATNPIGLESEAFVKYCALPGEAESRNVPTRRDFNPRSRRFRFPLDTLDIAQPTGNEPMLSKSTLK
jgi:hypothetical protein